MSFIASGILPAVAYQNIKRHALNVKQTCQDARVAAESTVGADRILALMNQMVGFKTSLAREAATPGLDAYATSQEDDPSYDVSAEYLAVRSAITDVIDEIVSTFPVATYLTIGAGGIKTYQSFPSNTLSDLRTKLDVVIAAIS